MRNIFRKKLSIKSIISHPHLPLHLARMLPIHFKTSSDKLLYHSSFYRRLVTTSRVCEISTVHDFIHSKFSSGIKKIIHNKLKFGSIRRSAGIICVSNHTYSDLKKFCTLRNNQKIRVIYNGISDEYKPVLKGYDQNKEILRNINLNEKFLLFVGARSGYKNFDFVVKLLKDLPDYRLAVVGNKFSDIEQSQISKDLLQRIVVANSISNIDLNILYNYAHALIYSSSYEGFGIPIAEAMKAGCPVIALNTSSIPEISGNAAMLFDNLDVSGFVNAIKNLENKNLRNEMREKGFENSKRFSWQKCIDETKEFYKETYNGFA